MILEFLAATKHSNILVYDFRCIESKPLLCFGANRNLLCGINLNFFIPGLLATCGENENVKVWDISTYKPLFITKKDIGMRTCFTLAFSPYQPYLLATGGISEQILVWDIRGSVVF